MPADRPEKLKYCDKSDSRDKQGQRKRAIVVLATANRQPQKECCNREQGRQQRKGDACIPGEFKDWRQWRDPQVVVRIIHRNSEDLNCKP